MRKFALALGLLVGLAAVPANAAVVGNLGIDPTSSTGNFSNTVGGGSFSDDYLFQLVGGPAFVTLASATNVFPGGSSSSDFITNFTGEVIDLATNAVVLGPATGGPCQVAPTQCQVLSGSAILAAGNYELVISGIGGGTSGYGGNLAVSAVPLPPTLQMFIGGLLLFGALFWLKNRNKGPISAFA